MKSIKPGRGPSGMSFIGSIFAIVFGVFWTIIAFSFASTSPFGAIGMIFPLFGIIFIVAGVFQAVYHYKNATGKNRYSLYDITDSTEEGDPAERWIRSGRDEMERNRERFHNTGINYCPYCGATLKSDYKYCPECGKALS